MFQVIADDLFLAAIPMFPFPESSAPYFGIQLRLILGGIGNEIEKAIGANNLFRIVRSFQGPQNLSAGAINL